MSLVLDIKVIPNVTCCIVRGTSSWILPDSQSWKSSQTFRVHIMKKEVICSLNFIFTEAAVIVVYVKFLSLQFTWWISIKNFDMFFFCLRAYRISNISSSEFLGEMLDPCLTPLLIVKWVEVPWELPELPELLLLQKS